MDRWLRGPALHVLALAAGDSAVLRTRDVCTHPGSAHCETGRTAPRMPVAPRMHISGRSASPASWLLARTGCPTSVVVGTCFQVCAFDAARALDRGSAMALALTARRDHRRRRTGVAGVERLD